MKVWKREPATYQETLLVSQKKEKVEGLKAQVIKNNEGEEILKNNIALGINEGVEEGFINVDFILFIYYLLEKTTSGGLTLVEGAKLDQNCFEEEILVVGISNVKPSDCLEDYVVKEEVHVTLLHTKKHY